MTLRKLEFNLEGAKLYYKDLRGETLYKRHEEIPENRYLEMSQ